MSYDLILVRVPAGASDEDIEAAALAASAAENDAPPRAPDAAAEARKRALADALVAAYPELEGGELDYALIASTEGITEDEARRRYRWIELAGPEDGAGIQIALYDSWVGISMPSSGVEGDFEELWRYLEVLVREGGFAVFDPQGPNVVDVAAGPYGDRTPRAGKRNRSAGRGRSAKSPPGLESSESEDGVEKSVPASEIGRLIDQIVANALDAPLQAAGYRKTGRTWRRRVEGAVQVVSIQGPRRNEGAEGRFTVNAGVYFPALAKRLAVFPPTDTPKEYDCHLRKRPLPPGRDGWKVRIPGATEPDADVGGLLGALFSWLDRRADRRAPREHERATSELRESLERYALPWLERVANLRAARDEFVRTGQRMEAVAASLELGEREEAARLFDQALAKKPASADDMRRWGKANGLTP